MKGCVILEGLVCQKVKIIWRQRVSIGYKRGSKKRSIGQQINIVPDICF